MKDNPELEGSMHVGVLCGTDKTTVSVATGQNDYHPVYAGLTNIHNSMRRAHKEAIIPAAFLAIPKGRQTNLCRYWPSHDRDFLAAREHTDTPEFRRFTKQLYHASLAKIYAPIRQFMTEPDVARCPDRHFRRVVYDIGPIIADYPEQVVLAGIVQGWCPKCCQLAIRYVVYLYRP